MAPGDNRAVFAQAKSVTDPGGNRADIVEPPPPGLTTTPCRQGAGSGAEKIRGAIEQRSTSKTRRANESWGMV